MKLNQDFAAVHGYLCADGYVIRNPPQQRHKYYRAGLRNTCLVLLEDFQVRCERLFHVSPSIYRNERCDLRSKEVYYNLTENNTSYYSKDWKLPEMSNKCLKLWLRAYFDCDGWMFIQGRQNRHIGLDSINHTGLISIQNALKKFGINSRLRPVKNGKMSRLLIYGRDNLEKYAKQIGFLHPAKSGRLLQALGSYVTYEWNFPAKPLLREFIITLVKEKARLKKNGVVRIDSIIKNNLIKLSSCLNELFGIESKVYGPWVNGYGTKYFELVVQKRGEVEKLRAIFLQ